MGLKFKMIDKNAVKIPKIILSNEACAQLSLMLLNDFTLQDKKFRIQISGKGCDGFTYSAGFTSIHPDDLLIKVENIEILVDPFSAFYLENTFVDYVFNFENGTEGFVISNKNQEMFAGKFWKEDPSKIPPQISNQ
jgi:iron-sulfur cluster assembly accessory protein